MTNPVIPSVLPKYARGRQRVPGSVNGLILPRPFSTVAYDTFTDADATNLTAHTMNTGAGWTAGNGSITVVSNKATCQSATNTYLTTVSYRDVRITCKITCGAATNAFAPTILIRAEDATHWVGAYFSGDGAGVLYKMSNATFTQLGSFIWAADTSEHSITITAIADEITVQVDSGMIWKFIAPQQNSLTKCGIRGFVSAGNKDKFDDFKVEAYLNTTRLDTFPSPLPYNNLTDAFTGADTTRLNTFGWTEDTGQWQISGNKATQTLAAAPTNGYVVSRDIGFSDVALEVAITTPSASGFICGLVFRMQDKNNYLEAELNTTNGATGVGKGFALWYTNNTGVYTEIASTHIALSNSTTYTMRIRAVGELITAELVESGLSLQCRCRMFMNATRVGLFEYRNAGTYPNANLYDNFKAYNG